MHTPSGNPQPDNYLAGLTNFQWYFYQAQQTVFYIAFTETAPTEERLIEVARDLIEIAPQLARGFAGIHQLTGREDNALAHLTSLKEVDDLSTYPAAFDVQGTEIFRDTSLPVFRVSGIVRRDGPDDKGRAGAICILASHTLLEGLDSVEFSRSQAHMRDMSRPVRPVAPRDRIWTQILAWLAAPVQLLIASIIAPRRIDRGYTALSISRSRIRAAAAKLGIGQRSLIFALAMFALNANGCGFSRRSIYATYVDLDPAYQGTSGDSFFRFRMMEARFAVHRDFATFARNVDAGITRGRTRDTTATQRFLTALFGVHRRLKTTAPFLYPERIFRFGGTYHLDLSLTPPHRLSGSMTRDMLEPVYCGTLNPGLNVCVFVPSGGKITFNFTVRNHLAKHVAMVEELLDNLLHDGDTGD